MVQEGLGSKEISPITADNPARVGKLTSVTACDRRYCLLPPASEHPSDEFIHFKVHQVSKCSERWRHAYSRPTISSGSRQSSLHWPQVRSGPCLPGKTWTSLSHSRLSRRLGTSLRNPFIGNQCHTRMRGHTHTQIYTRPFAI